MRTLKDRKESAVVLEEVRRPEVLKKPERGPELGKEDVSGQICPSHCTHYYYTPPCPSKQ